MVLCGIPSWVIRIQSTHSNCIPLRSILMTYIKIRLPSLLSSPSCQMSSRFPHACYMSIHFYPSFNKWWVKIRNTSLRSNRLSPHLHSNLFSHVITWCSAVDIYISSQLSWEDIYIQTRRLQFKIKKPNNIQDGKSLCFLPACFFYHYRTPKKSSKQ
jgi:hypothetical protein